MDSFEHIVNNGNHPIGQVYLCCACTIYVHVFSTVVDQWRNESEQTLDLILYGWQIISIFYICVLNKGESTRLSKYIWYHPVQNLFQRIPRNYSRKSLRWIVFGFAMKDFSVSMQYRWYIVHFKSIKFIHSFHYT